MEEIKINCFNIFKDHHTQEELLEHVDRALRKGGASGKDVININEDKLYIKIWYRQITGE